MRSFPTLAISKGRWQIESVRVPTIALWVGALTLLGFALRLAWVLYLDTIPLGGDPHWYYVVGLNLAHGNGFVAPRDPIIGEIVGSGQPTAFWPPGYPFALAAVFKFFGDGYRSAEVLNVLLASATIPVIYALGKRIFDRTAGLIAAGIYAVFPPAISGVVLLFPEPLFTFIFLLAIWILISNPVTSQRWLPFVCFGALTGMACLTRGQGLALVPIAALYWLASAGWRPTARAMAITLAAAVAIIMPWTVRNAVEMHAFIPISTNSAAALRVGHNPDGIGTTKWTDDVVDGFTMEESPWRPDWEVKGYRTYSRLAIKYALTHPVDELDLSRLKVYYLYRTDVNAMDWLTTLGTTPIEPEWLEDSIPPILDWTYYVVLFAALFSTPLWLRRHPERMLLVNVVLVWTFFHIVFLGEPRYHVPLFPFFVIAIGGGITTALARRVRRYS